MKNASLGGMSHFFLAALDSCRTRATHLLNCTVQDLSITVTPVGVKILANGKFWDF